MLNIISNYKTLIMYGLSNRSVMELVDNNDVSTFVGDTSKFHRKDCKHPIYIDTPHEQSCVGDFYSEPFLNVKHRILAQSTKQQNDGSFSILPFNQIPIYDFIIDLYYGKSSILDRIVLSSKLMKDTFEHHPFNLLWYLDDNSLTELFPILEFYMYSFYEYDVKGGYRHEGTIRASMDNFNYYPIDILDEMAKIDCGSVPINDIMEMVNFVHKGYTGNDN